jgi:hypothetical protein
MTVHVIRFDDASMPTALVFRSMDGFELIAIIRPLSSASAFNPTTSGSVVIPTPPGVNYDRW